MQMNDLELTDREDRPPEAPAFIAKKSKDNE